MSDDYYIRRDVGFPLHEVDLRSADDAMLERISRESGTGLSLDEMRMVKEHFVKLGRNPTDIELQSIGQAWSEHCCYKSSKVFLKDYVFNIDTPQVMDRGDAGIMEFDEEHAYALRIESHNHPSAVEPYGGAATGIGGIVRDVLCMGCQPIALIDPLFFGPLDIPHEELPKGAKHPKYLFGGVVAGIRDYGNRIGIPTVAGGVYFHKGYVGNCLVNVGCVGIAEKKHLYRNRVKSVGDVMVLVGGRTGRDGIHGVTFASRVLTEKSEEEDRGAVQLGDPIMKEPLIHACLEVAGKGLITGMKDLGGGGLSCVVGEMALAAGFGAEVELDKVPLKEEGLAPWEIWVSESQERMMLAVEPDRLDDVLHVFRLFDVPATVIGKVIPEKMVRLLFNGEKIFDMDLEFLTEGPEYCRPCRAAEAVGKAAEVVPEEPEDYKDILFGLLGDENICDRSWVIRQYDHEVRGNTVLKPLQGKIGRSSHGDASVLKPLGHSYRGLALAIAVNPWLTEVDPYKGGKSTIDEVCRNLAAVGARPHSLTDCMNFGNPEKPERLWEFREATRGMGEVALHMKLPIPSGNVSFYNETETEAVPPTPTVLGVGIVSDIRKCVTSDLKGDGNPIFIIGQTRDEMGGSAYYRLFGGKSNTAPDVDLKVLESSVDKVVNAVENGWVASCHDISDGGIGVCISEMCIGGDLGADMDISKIGSGEQLRGDIKLFSESNTRWLVEVKKEFEEHFVKSFGDVFILKVGEARGRYLKIKDSEKALIDVPVDELRKKWTEPLQKLMGGGE